MKQCVKELLQGCRQITKLGTVSGNASTPEDSTTTSKSAEVSTLVPKATEICVVCLCVAFDIHITKCGHYHCKECLSRQLAARPATNAPFRCVGRYTTCSHTFITIELKAALTIEQFNQVLHSERMSGGFQYVSFARHLAVRPSTAKEQWTVSSSVQSATPEPVRDAITCVTRGGLARFNLGSK